MAVSVSALLAKDFTPLNRSGHLPSAPECEPLPWVTVWHQHYPGVTLTHLEAHIQGQRASARWDWVETCHTSKALCRKCRGSHCHSVDIQTWWLEERRTTSPYEIRAASDEECMAGGVLKRIARENVNVSLTLPASWPFNREFAPRSATQSVEKSDSVTPPLQVSTQSQRALALCPWMWASKWVTVWHQH